MGGVFAVPERIRHPFLTRKTLPTPNLGELHTKLSPRPALLNPNFGELTEYPNPVPIIYIYSPEG